MKNQKRYIRTANFLMDVSDLIAKRLQEDALFPADQARAMSESVMSKMADSWGGTSINFLTKYRRERIVSEGSSECARRRIGFFNDLEHHIQSELEVRGAKCGEALTIAESIIDYVGSGNQWGTGVYVPKALSQTDKEMLARNEEICKKFSRGNANALAIEYGLSRIRIFQIVKADRDKRRVLAAATATPQARQVGRYQATTINP